MPRATRFACLTIALVFAILLAPGAARAAEIILYDHRNFGGQSVTLNQSAPSLGNFDNEASSVQVISGTWELFRNDDYGVTPSRPSLVLQPGDYPDLGDVGFPRNRLSSVKLLEAPPPPPPPPPPAPQCQPGQVQGNTNCITCANHGSVPSQTGDACLCPPGSTLLSNLVIDGVSVQSCEAPPAPPPAAPQPGAERPAIPPGGLVACELPYRFWSRQGGEVTCLWNCGTGTVPDAASNECVCEAGTYEAGTDAQGRRFCGTFQGAQPAQPDPARQQYVVAGANAVGMAMSVGFQFANSRREGDGRCIQSAAVVTAEAHGIVPLLPKPKPLYCLATFFYGRTLNPGWELVAFEFDEDVHEVRQPTAQEPAFAIILVFSASTVAPFNDTYSVVLESITLEGPAGRNWRDAFQ